MRLTGLILLLPLFLAACGGAAGTYSSTPPTARPVAAQPKATHIAVAPTHVAVAPTSTPRPAPTATPRPAPPPTVVIPPTAPPAVVAPAPAPTAMGCIPEGNGGDQDGDNNGAFSDGDGCR